MAKNNETLPTLGNNPRTAVIGSVIITVLLFILIPLSQMLSFHKDRTNITLTEMMMPPPPPPPPHVDHVLMLYGATPLAKCIVALNWRG